jgi:ABC-type phosphate transport system substrate-binding protein
MNQCLQALPDRAIAYSEYPATSLLDQSADVSLRWDAPIGLNLPTFELGSDHLVFIVHPKNPLTQLNIVELQAVFTGEYSTWMDACPECVNMPEGEIELWTYAPGDDIQNLFEETILSDSRISTGAFLASSPTDVLNAVSQNPSAIGYLPAAWFKESSVQEIMITDLSTTTLTRPVLAITSSQPQGDLSAWLACLSQLIP